MNIEQWKTNIERAKAFQGQYHKQWEDAIDLINCEYFDKNLNGKDIERVDVHFANWYYNNLVPLVYFRDPFIFIKHESDNWQAFAETMEKAVNKVWKDLKVKQQFKRTIGSAFTMPPGWIKIGYTAEIGQDVDKLEEEKEKGLLSDIKDLITGVFKKEDEDDDYPEKLGVLNQYIKEESCFITWINSWNILMPEGYHLVSDMPYLIEVEHLPMLDFMRNPMYKNKKNIKPTREIQSSSEGKIINKVPFLKGGGQTTINKYSETDIIDLYHIWDRRNMERKTVSMFSEEYHFEGDWPYDMPGFPYKPLIFEESLPTPRKSNPYPPNIFIPIMPQIIEQSMSRTQMAKWRKRASAIILAQKGLLTEEDLAQLEETESLQIAYVSNIDAVKMSQSPALPPEVFDVDAIIKQDLQSATNMGQMMFQAQKGTRTATQAQIGQSGLQLKASARVDVVEDFTVDVAESLAVTLWQFYDRDKIKELIGEEVSESMWPDYPKDKKEARRVVQSYLKLRIDAGSTAPPKDETVDKKQILDFASILSSIAPERLKKDEFAKQLVKKFKFTKEVDKLIISNDEEEEKAAMEENGLLQENHPQIVSPNTNHMLHLQIHAQIQKPTMASDAHIADHAKFAGIPMGGKEGGNKPQKGDMRPPMKSTNPEVVRQGATKQGDVYQSTQNAGVGTGGGAA